MEVSGAAELVSWFGCWPSFHDAEIISLALNRSGDSSLKVYTWQRTTEIDDRGFYIQMKHVLVRFRLEGISSLTLSDFSCQNVIFGLSLSQTEEGFKIDLDPCYGLPATIAAKKLSIDFEPVPAGFH
jgi:hypothetical protein